MSWMKLDRSNATRIAYALLSTALHPRAGLDRILSPSPAPQTVELLQAQAARPVLEGPRASDLNTPSLAPGRSLNSQLEEVAQRELVLAALERNLKHPGCCTLTNVSH